MTGLNAEAFIRRHGFNKQSYLRLERGEAYLRDPIFQRILEALAIEGVVVSKQWIIDGTGEPPKKVPKKNFDLKEDELDVFRKRENSIIISVKNDNLKPIYKRGDHVGGIFVQDKSLCHNKICIVSFEERIYAAYVIILKEIILTFNINNNYIEVIDFFEKEDFLKCLLAPVIFHKSHHGLYETREVNDGKDFYDEAI